MLEVTDENQLRERMGKPPVLKTSTVTEDPVAETEESQPENPS